MKTIATLSIASIALLASCFDSSTKDFNSRTADSIVQIIERASLDVGGMQFKGLDARGASQLYEEYKKLKLHIIQKYFAGDDYLVEIGEIVEIKKKFDSLTLDPPMADDADRGIRENPYIAEFENRFIESLVKNAISGVEVDISSLRIVYDN